MLAGTSKEDKDAMLQAQKQAESNFEATKKMMTAPPPVQAPVYQQPAYTPTPAPFVPQVLMSSTGKPMPAQPPQEEL
jgi:hypothetical protein